MNSKIEKEKKKVYIVGVGLGQEQFLTQEAKDILENADIVYTTVRIGEGLQSLLKKVVTFKVSEIVSLIQTSDKNIVIMVSGDTGFYSLANTIAKNLPKSEADLIRINGISSMQYFLAKLGKSYENVELISLHGREGNIVAHVNYNAQVFALTGGNHRVVDVCQQLLSAKMDHIRISVGENLGNVDKQSANREKIYTLSPKEIIHRDKSDPISDLSVMYFENLQPTNPHTMIRDSDLLRGNAPMTKEEIRHLSVAKLDIQPQDIVYDIGAGTGSVSLEMAKKAFESTVYAIEQKQEAFDLLEKNKEQLNIYNVESILAKAPDGLANLPVPNKVFIGGSGKNMGEIINVIIDKMHQSSEEDREKESSSPKEIHFVVNTIALESLTEANHIFSDLKFEEVDYISISSSKSKKVGSYNMMMANNPIYIISAKYRI